MQGLSFDKFDIIFSLEISKLSFPFLSPAVLQERILKQVLKTS